MQSKTSCFNKCLFRKDLTRFAPLWMIYLAVLLISLPVLVLTTGLSPNHSMDAAEFQDIIFSSITGIGPILVCAAGICSAMAVFSYLFTARSIGLYHTLPVTRRTLFFTNYLAGLLFLVVPHTITALFLLLAGSILGTPAFMTALIFWAVMTAMALFFYSFTVFCCMFTGQLLAVPVFSIALNLLVFGIGLLISSLLGTFQFGIITSSSDVTRVFSPLLQLIRQLNILPVGPVDPYGVVSEITGYTLIGWKWLVIYAVAGLVFAILALVAYRYRRSETAGDLVTVKWAQWLFRLGVGACAALTLGTGLYEVFYYQLIGGYHNNAGILLLFLLFAGLAGYYLAEMLLQKSFRVFRKGWKGAAILCACLILVTSSVRFDLFGIVSYVPTVDEIGSISLSGISNSDGDTLDSTQFEQVVALHQSILEHQTEIETRMEEHQAGTTAEESVQYIGFNYTLKNGRRISRMYNFCMTPDDLQAGSYITMLDDLVNGSAARENLADRLDQLTVNYGYVDLYYGNDTGESVELDNQQDVIALRDAISADLRNGTLQADTWFAGDTPYYGIDLQGVSRTATSYEMHHYYSFAATTEATNTYAFLSSIHGLMEENRGISYTVSHSTHPDSAADAGTPELLTWSNTLLEFALSDPDAQDAINADLRQSYNDLEAQYDTRYAQAEADYQARKESGFSDTWSAYVFHRNATPVRADSAVISVLYDDSTYTGGAHGEDLRSCVNYRTDTGAKLTLADLTDDLPALQEVIHAELLRQTQLPQYEGYFFDGYEKSLFGLIADGSWYLSDDGLVIVCNPYIIAPFAAGILEFTVSYSQLGDLILEQYLPIVD